ncbi:MAG: TonB family protein [Geminicoccaceae bacterium]|nr:TonB family protein [Geminicoccaceae bacterium]
MFDVLPASGAHPGVRPTSVSTSIITHALVVLLAVLATQGALDGPRMALPPEAMLFYVPKPEPPPPPVAPRPEPAMLVIAQPPPKGFQTVAAPSEIPTVIPPVDLNQRPFDPRDFSGIGVEGGVADGVVGGTSVVTRPDAIYEATTMLDGFAPAVLLAQPAPTYPALLHSAGLGGSVMVEFVVDTIGQVEQVSIRVVESTHPGFQDAARAAVLGARFQPARLGPHHVRQLTRQRVRFVAAQ